VSASWHDFSVPPGRALKRLDEASALCMGDWPARSGDGPADMLVATRWERICRGWAHCCRYQRCGAGFRDAEVGFADQMSARGPVASLRTRPWRREGTKARFLRSEFLQASTKSTIGPNGTLRNLANFIEVKKDARPAGARRASR
jgi:hypothetical protein